MPKEQKERALGYKLLPSDFETVARYAAPPMRSFDREIVTRNEISLSIDIDTDSPAYQRAVERTATAIHNLIERRKKGKSS